MKEFFKNKTNLILSIILIVLIGVGVFMGLTFLKEPEVTAIDFSNMSEEEITDWATKNNVINKFEFKHEYDANIPEGGIVYYSIKEGEIINENIDKVLIIISDGKDTSNQLEIPIDENTTKETLAEWFNTNNFIDVTYEEVESYEYTAGHVISVEPTKAEPTDKVTVKVAVGQLIEVPDFSFYSDEEITNWSKENGIKIVYQEEISNTVKKGNFIKQSISAGKQAAVGSSITITISSGDGTSNEKTAYIDPYKYLGYTETDFLKALKELGYTNIKKLDAVFSSKQKKDTVCYYLPDGNQKTTAEISYKLSLGEFDVSSFNGKTKTEGESLIKSVSDSSNVDTLKITETETTDTTKQGKLYDCSLSSNTVTCKLGITSTSSSSTETAYIPTNLYGDSITESIFKSKLNELGFTNLQKVNIYSSGKTGTVRAYDPDGTQTKSTTIKYALSMGSFNASDYNGLTSAKADEKISSLNSSGANLTLVKNSVETTAKTEGTIYDCSLSTPSYYAQTITCKLAKSSTTTEEKVTLDNWVGKDNPCGSNSTCSLNNINYTIVMESSTSVAEGKVISQSPSAGQVAKGTSVTLKVSSGVSKSTILEFDTFESYYSKSTYDATYAAIKTYFDNQGFTNVTYKGTEAKYAVGTLISISVNGITDYTAGEYYINVPIIVTICSSEKN